jgi:hypothetical protein
MTYLFSFGSNHPDQLAERMEVSKSSLMIYPAYAPGWKRAFRGFSNRWNGGTATLIKKPGAKTYGFVVKVSEGALDKLDVYEGVSQGVYSRKIITVDMLNEKDNWKSVKAVAYLSSRKDFNAPSKKYLEAIVKTIMAGWSDSVKISDIDIR